jgi:RNAse (barnase) inhibitor barstar
LEEFYDEIDRVFAPDIAWGRNLDAFEDLLRGGFGMPDNGFILRWENADLSRQSLSYAETIRQLQMRLRTCNVDFRPIVLEQLAAAQKSQGPTVFDWLVEIIRQHGDGGEEATDGIELQVA